jgi:hypothetical protein
MKRILLFILPCILAACTTASLPDTQVATEPEFNLTKLFAITAEAKTQTSGYPKNDATLTAIIGTKSAGGTAMAASMTAQPGGTPIPTIPPDSLFCTPADLRTSFGSNAANQQILLGASLTNTSRSPCFLQAWPQVLLVDRQGQPIDVDYHYFDVGGGDAVLAATKQAQESTTARIGLWPGWETWLTLSWGNWCGLPIPAGVVIRLTLINNAGNIDIPTDISGGGACNAPGFRSDVGISKFGPAVPPP